MFCLGATRQDAFPKRWASGAPGAGDGPVFLHPSPQHLFCSDPFDLDACAPPHRSAANPAEGH